MAFPRTLAKMPPIMTQRSKILKLILLKNNIVLGSLLVYIIGRVIASSTK